MWKATTVLNVPNVTTNFYPSDDQWDIVQMPFKASTAVAEGAAIGIEISGSTTTGYVTLMWVENAAGADFVGIAAEPIVSGDADYATAWKLKGVKIPRSIYAQAFFTVWAGTFTAIDIGKTVQFASTSLALDVDTAGKWARIKGYISATRGICDFSLPATETA